MQSVRDPALRTITYVGVVVRPPKVGQVWSWHGEYTWTIIEVGPYEEYYDACSGPRYRCKGRRNDGHTTSNLSFFDDERGHGVWTLIEDSPNPCGSCDAPALRNDYLCEACRGTA